ncbi:MAG TPA: diaminopimelate epimerase [Sporichthyaceae bacterium]|jgi:diaminopimelate epimerase|nr:diaminopimelate epimerase [Sporichthyaceae bacterium]
MTEPLPFVKGHGTENDFVLIPDRDGELALSAAEVAAICDRRAGIGADGILRVVAVAAEPEAAAFRGRADWFMDYRNADGSIAEMCGNGIRVFARYLVDFGLAAPGALQIATRGGLRNVICPPAGSISVDMGVAVLPEVGPITVRVGERSWSATAVLMPNPHAVVFVDDLTEAGDLREPPEVGPAEAFPDGVNVEFVVRRGPRHLALRVHERGSGETRSCGTGVCAAVVAAVLSGRTSPGVCVVDVPGGTLETTATGTGPVLLAGPAELVAAGFWGVANGSPSEVFPCDAGARAAGRD